MSHNISTFRGIHKGDFISKNKHVITVLNDSFITQGQRSGSHYFIHPFHLFQIVINIFYKLYYVLSVVSFWENFFAVINYS